MTRWTALASGIALLGIAVSLGAISTSAGATDSRGGSPWAGFALEDTSPNNLTTATSSWVVPQITCRAGENSRAAEWVGLGGDFYSFFQRILADLGGPPRFEPLYQAGSDSDCSNGHATYDAWEEVYADGQYKPQILLKGKAVEAEDTMSVSLIFDAKNHTGRWVVTDSRSGAQAWREAGTWTNTPAGFHTAECIVEDPQLSGGKTAALTEFTVVPFKGCHTTSSAGQADATSTTLPGHWSRHTINMKLGSKVLAVAGYNPLRVTQGSSSLSTAPPCSSSSIMAAVKAYAANTPGLAGLYQPEGQPTCRVGWATMQTEEVSSSGQVLGPDQAFAQARDGSWKIVALVDGDFCGTVPAAGLSALGYNDGCPQGSSSPNEPPTSTTTSTPTTTTAIGGVNASILYCFTDQEGDEHADVEVSGADLNTLVNNYLVTVNFVAPDGTVVELAPTVFTSIGQLQGVAGVTGNAVGGPSDGQPFSCQINSVTQTNPPNGPVVQGNGPLIPASSSDPKGQ